MAKAPGAPLGPVPFADVEADSGLVSGVPEQLPEEHADPDDLVSALPSAPRPKGLSSLRLYDGFWLPEWSVPAAVALQRRFEPRPDDVVVASFPKCGTTWVNALTFATMARRAHPAAGAGHPLLRLNPHQCVPFLEALFGSRRGLPSPRLMNTHMPLAMMPGGGGCKVVYVCRE
uniref:Sulfotransferase n=1 Tax=Triticum urartu TaxID=4572 RepID=A0A8R7QL51_TRIUA